MGEATTQEIFLSNIYIPTDYIKLLLVWVSMLVLMSHYYTCLFKSPLKFYRLFGDMTNN